MKKLLLPLLCALILFAGCTEVKREYYSNGKLKSETHYRFGKETGTTTFYHYWYPTIIMEVEMKKGMKNGKMIKRFFDNKTEMIAFYQNDLLDGTETYYYKNGNCSLETHYTKGKKNGKITSWYSNGEIKESGMYINDMFDGEWVNYDERGLLIGEGSFNVGTGKRITYDEMGRLQCETNFVNNKKDGLETHFFPNGQIEKTLKFVKDRIIEINGVSVDNL
ncbi:MAG: hypothetical protein LBU83_04815 [Bacteroidales bacterium]|jgi:antitoxin component YwqK of YwqJK toxin-antitoxin module|nr:hypothetical protein [Bacteroidales bacterium]